MALLLQLPPLLSTAPSSSVVVDGGSHEEDGISVFTEDDSTPKAAGSTISQPLLSKQQQSSSRQRNSSNHRQQQSNRNTILHGLPDSFAPLLSSSEMEVVTTGITADLIHAVQIQAQIRFRQGRHIIPLDKDERRPQFWFDSKDATDIMAQGENDDSSPKKGCKVSASVTVGSERFSLDEDLDTNRRTQSRSRPMVKGADLREGGAVAGRGGGAVFWRWEVAWVGRRQWEAAWGGQCDQEEEDADAVQRRLVMGGGMDGAVGATRGGGWGRLGIGCDMGRSAATGGSMGRSAV